MKRDVFLRTPYNYDMDKASEESGLECKDKTRTKQSFADECDINNIVERFGVTGEIPVLERTPITGDLGTGMDFMEAQNLIIAARHHFEELPAKVRSRFHNEPREFVEFANDPDNKDELRKWGLLKPEEPQAPPPAKIDPQPPLTDKTPPKDGGVT